MIELYAPAEFSHVKRVRLWWILAYVAFAAVMVAANVLCAVLLRPVSYWGGLILNIVLTILFGGATLFFFCLPFRMLNAYYKTYRNMNRGLKETVRGTVLRFDEEGVTKDNLECYGLVIEPNAKKSKSLPVRRILIEHTRPAPELVRGDTVICVTHANFLLSYEVTGHIELPPSEEYEDAEQKETEQDD